MLDNLEYFEDPPKIEEDTTSMEEKRAAKIEVRDDSRTQRNACLHIHNIIIT